MKKPSLAKVTSRKNIFDQALFPIQSRLFYSFRRRYVKRCKNLGNQENIAQRKVKFLIPTKEAHVDKVSLNQKALGPHCSPDVF